MSYKLSLTSVFLALTLTSCAVTDVIDAVLPSDKPAIEANVAVGKTNLQDKVLVKGVDNRQVADKIENTTKAETINNSNVSVMFLMLLILGWILPTPTNMFKGVVSFFKGD